MRREQKGRLDILVNDVWGGDALTAWGKTFWKLDVRDGLQMIERAVHSHIITARYAAPLMVERKRGLIVEITDGDGLYYRGQFFYDFVKVSCIRLAFAMSEELRKHRVAAVAVTPGFLRSKRYSKHGVTEENARRREEVPSFTLGDALLRRRAVARWPPNRKVMKKTGRPSAPGRWRRVRLEDAEGRRPNVGVGRLEHGGMLKSIKDPKARSVRRARPTERKNNRGRGGGKGTEKKRKNLFVPLLRPVPRPRPRFASGGDQSSAAGVSI